MTGTTNSAAESTTDTNGNASVQAQSKPRAQIARYDMVFNQQTYRYEAKKSQKPVIPKQLKKKRAIVVVKRFLGSKGQHEKTIIEIHHETLNEILQEIYGDMENMLSDGDGTVDARLLYYSYGELKDRLQHLEETNTPEDHEKIEGIQAAVRFIEEDFKATIDAFDTLTSKRQTTYEYMWTLFRPKTHVCAYDSSTEQTYIALVQKFTYQTPPPPAAPHAEIECEILAHDNMSLGRAEITLNIPTFKGARSIVDLPAFPFKYHEDCDALREKAIARGKAYASMRLYFCQHHGVASVNSLKLLINERIMVDPESSYQYGIRGDYVYQRLNPEDLSDDDYLICTPILLGFCFTTKAWGRFAIDRIADVQWSNEPFDRLVLGSKQKRLISALVKQHTSKSAAFDDIVAGKGKGLVGLLCGKPGCGKTLTAEAVAEVTHKPLYAVSAGELGTDPGETDEALKRILRLGERWNAVVLLDEADVFMQERDRTDVTRNALVSIFLRQVEYYPGILIFTTNLIDQIDSAFESRIHFCVKYPALDFASRKTIWRTFLSRADSVKDTFGEHDLVSLARKPLNGRQIKNVVSTAKSIASSETSPLALKHIETVLEVMQDWQIAKYERATHLYHILLSCAAVFIAFAVVMYLRSALSTPSFTSPSFLRL